MKLLSSIDENKDAVTKEYVDNKMGDYVTLGTAQTITGNKTFNGTLKMSNINNATYDTSSTTNISPSSVGLVNPPWNKDLWHDHFAFMRYHTIESQETTADGTTWTTANKDLKNLFAQKENLITNVLSSSETGYRFTLKNSAFAWSGVSWFEISVAYTNPFSQFEVIIEHSADLETWNTCHDSTIVGTSQPFFLRNGYSISTDGYTRFTFLKKTNLDTGTVSLTCIKALCTRKGNQGLGIEFEYPYDWDNEANIYPISNATKDLGSSSKKWDNVYANTFNGNLTGTASKATGDKNGNDITTTYYKASNPNGYTSNTGTITEVSVNGTSVATSGAANITAATGVKGDSESSYRTGNVNITKANIGLGNVENKSSATIRGELTSSNVTTALGYTPINSNLKGANNGLAELDANGKVPSAQLPSYVDDVIEYTSQSAFPTTGETGKIYIAQDTNKTYRWSGTAYVEISPSLALGETSSTAYRGDRGKVAYDHSQSTHARTDATAVASSTTNGNIKINGTETTVYSHPSSGVTAGTYKSVTVDGNGHVTGGSNPTTLSGYGITDAKINNGTITLGNNTITPLTSFTETDPVFSASAAADISSADISNWNGKQAALVSGTNIKTVNGNSLLGSGNITISGGSSSYNDLTNKPQINGNELSGNKTAAQLGFATVATSGSYNDLSNKPSIPTVNNGTLTIQKNGSTVATFTANQSGGSTANITVPGVYNGTGAPASTLGSDGDIYIQLG